MQSANLRPLRRLPLSCLLAFALHPAGCVDDEHGTDANSAAADARSAVAAALADPSGGTPRTIALPAAPEHTLDIRVKHLGVFPIDTARPDFTAEFESMRREWRPVTELTESAATPPADDELMSWVGFRAVDEGHYEIELLQARSADLVRFGQAAQDTGATRARPGAMPISDAEENWAPRSWSDGDDSRTRLSIADGYSANFWPFRTIGRMNQGCTGTMIGRRTVLTAAHCVFNRSAWSVVPGTFAPRRDSGATQNPHGTSPYLQGNGYWTWVPSAYWQEIDCDGINCNAWDIAVFEIEDNLGDTVGTMGYGAVSVTVLQNSDNRMRGYPSCSRVETWSPSRPDDNPNLAGIQCTNNALYGDTQMCDIYGWPADTMNCWNDGWSCELDITCDGSPGMSGSGVYTYDAPGAGGDPVIFGVYSQYNCVPPNCSDPSENVITRITPGSVGFISAFVASNGG